MRLNSIKLPHYNDAAEKKTVVINTPKYVTISMSQHVGVPCVPVVGIGDKVYTGQIIGNSEAYISAPVHSSVTGKVIEEKNILSINGKLIKALVIESENRQELLPDIVKPEINSRADFIKAVRDSGSVGLGGAGFPTHVKIGFDKSKVKIDTLLINGAECEPYITSDYREMIENSQDIFDGIRLIMKILEIEKTVIGIENDKPFAIKKAREMITDNEKIHVKSLKARYPQGAEKVLIYQTTGRIIKEGELPMTAGCLVLNVSTVAFLANYFKTGIPLINRRLTIDGNIVNKPMNLIVPIGITLRDLLTHIDLRLQPDRIILGGPMMGNTVYDLDMPISKTNNAVLFFNNSPAHNPSACIRCGKCIMSCSMRLMPVELEHAYDARDKELLKKLKLNTCMNCGACTYVCPAKRSISEKNQLAKIFIRNT